VIDGFQADANAKTLSLFATAAHASLSREAVEALVNEGKRRGETVRLCLHGSPEETLQLMLIYHPLPKKIPVQKFLTQDSIYLLMEGEFNLFLLDDGFRVQNTFHLAENDQTICKIAAGAYYKMEMVSQELLFIEVRNGPYRRENQITIDKEIIL